jgi:hypothetical protein
MRRPTQTKSIAALCGAGLVFVTMGLWGCGGDGGSGDGTEITTGTLRVAVTAAGTEPAEAVEGARVVVTNGVTGEALAVLVTDESGLATIETEPATCRLRITAQGYHPSPPGLGTDPVPFEVTLSELTDAGIRLISYADPSGYGWISGSVVGADGTTGIPHALVVSDAGEAVHSVTTDADGHFVVFNVSEGAVELSAWHAGYDFDAIPVQVSGGAHTSGALIAARAAAVGTVSGQVSFLATSAPAEGVDVTLIHPKSGDVIPGLRVHTDDTGTSYELATVPDGSFHAIASLDTDGYVLDPDSVVKHGIPEVELAGGLATPSPLNFDLTGAVLLESPSGKPKIPRGEDLVVRWVKTSSYASAKLFVLEMVDESGDIVAGGFDRLDWWLDAQANAQQGGEETFWEEIVDTSSLEEGRAYQVRVYAVDDDDKDDVPGPTDTVLSATEDLEGVFTVGPPPLCSDGVDNDGDGWLDAADPDCFLGTEEVGLGPTQCNDGVDNDGDTVTDNEDPHCADASDDDEGL